MTVLGADKDPATLSMTLVAESDAAPTASGRSGATRASSSAGGVRRPTRPRWRSTPGGRVTYFMTGPDGEKPRGYWRITAAEPPF